MPPSITDQGYLKNEQYSNGNNLDARIQLHRRFSTNPAIFFEWMYDQLEMEAGIRVLEAGCGTGEFWRTNFQRLPADTRFTLTDLSAGMAADARDALFRDPRFTYAVADVTNLPFGAQNFDLILANYMLYHVPDILRAVGELRRVLAPGGLLCAATNSTGHMGELMDLMRSFGLQVAQMHQFTSRYGLENAPEILGKFFANVQVIPFEDSLFVTETQPLIAYIRSMVGLWALPPDAEANISRFVDEKIRSEGGFTIRKASGAVLAW